MLLAVLFLLCASLAQTTGQLTTGLYRIFNQWDFGEALAQDGSSIVTIGGIPSNDVKTVWYITPGSAADTYTIQNVKTLQYISVDGAPVSGSVPLPRASPFLWTYRQSTGEFGVNNLTLSIFLSSQKPTLLPRVGTDPSQNWRFTGSIPFPATYRIWNVATDSYLTAPANVPGILTAGPLDAQNALQYWTVAGADVSNQEGTIASVKTAGYIDISAGQIGTFSTRAPNTPNWQFAVVGGGARIIAWESASPNVIAIGPQGQVVAETEDSGNDEQVFVFVPALAPGVE